jgi:methionyl-tRNA formyltransferase
LVTRHDVPAVFTQPDRPAGRDLKLRPSPIKAAALALGIPVLQPEKLRAPEAAAELAAWEADLFVVAAYGQILPRRILDLPRLGCLNIHASLLPRHRGASPVHAAVLAGDTESGITIMQMDEGLDTGDILLREALTLAPRETAGTLHDRLAALAPGALLRTLDGLATGTISRVPQDHAAATYAPKLQKADGRIDWTLEAAALDRRLRGLSPWPGAHTTLPDGRLLKILDAVPGPGAGTPGTVLSADASGLTVAAGSGALQILRLQAAGGKALSAADFLRGIPLAVGARLGAGNDTPGYALTPGGVQR